MTEQTAEKVDKSERRVRRMFGEISPRYDLLNHLLSGGIDCYWRWRTVRAAPPAGNAPILDVCTGTGDLAFSYWKKGRRRVSVIGADFTHEMLLRAQDKRKRFLSSRSVPVAAQPATSASAGLHFIEADAQQLPFEDDRFQIVSVAFGLRNITETKRGLQEMARVCQPGGRVVVLEFSLPPNRLIRAVYGWYFRRILPKVGQLISGSREEAYSYLPASVAEFPEGEALVELMQQCGLREVTFRRLTFGVATLYIGRKPEKGEHPAG